MPAFFCDFSRTIQTRVAGLAPESCYRHRDERGNQDEDLSFMRVTIQRLTLQTAEKPLYRQLQKAARALGYKPAALTTKP